MARKGRRGNRLIKGTFDNSFTLGALPANQGIVDPTDDQVADRCYAISMEAVYTMTGLAAGETVYLYVAHSDWTLAEIEEFIENQQGWDEGNLRQREIANRGRSIKLIGAWAADGVLNDGRPLKTKLGFILADSDGLQFVAYNPDAAALTTGSEITALGHVWLRPT